MDAKARKRISKFLSYVLRHQPELIDLELDKNGWANTEELIQKSITKNHRLTLEILKDIVATNDKKRFSFNEDQSKIRANQGHSLQHIDLEMQTQEPPAILYHGTVAKFLESIQELGLVKGTRQHVHLSLDIETAKKVGSRRGIPVILKINAKQMHIDEYEFYLSANGVWLTDHVPAKYIIFPYLS